MCRIENDRCAGTLQDRQCAHVGDQSVVAEGDATLGDQHIAVARAGELSDDILHVPGRQELTLLDVDDLAGFGGGNQQIGLAAEECRNLQDVDDLRGAHALLDVVHVGQHRQLQALLDLGKDRQRRLQADAARGVRRGAVGLVEGGFKNQADAGFCRDLFQRLRNFERVRAALQLAGTGDQGQRQIVAEANAADVDHRVGLKVLVQGLLSPRFAGP